MSRICRVSPRRRSIHPGLPALTVLTLLTVAGLAPHAAAAAGAPAAWKLAAPLRQDVESLGRPLVEAVASGDAGRRRAAVAALFDSATVASVGSDRLEGQLERIGQTMPGLAFDRAELMEVLHGQEPSRVLHVYARQAGQKMWKDLQVRISPAAPYRLTQIVFIADVTDPVTLPNGEITTAPTLEWLNEYIDRLAAEFDLSGSLLVAQGDRVILERAFGFADAARRRPVSAGTLFSLASSSKMFTALAVASLVAEGRLTYDTPVERFFPDFPDRAFARKCTVGQLLSHTSGVREYWTSETTEALRTVRSTRDVLPFVYRAGTEFEPGTRFSYSNSNFILAGLIVEQVAGTGYVDFVRARILDPLEMRDSGFYSPRDSTRDIAEALGRAPGGRGWTSLPRGGPGTAAGGCLATARDMFRFVRGLVAGRVVSAATLAEMVASKTARLPEADTDYGYGFIRESSGGVESWGHGGITGGVNSEIRYFPALDITLVLLNNQDNGAYDDLRRTVTKLITGAR